MTEGERWAAQLLADLRAGGYLPRAWWSFLRDSFDRAEHTRRSRAALAGQARRWSSTGLAISLLARQASAGAGRSRPSPAAMVGWWLSLGAMLDWHLGMVDGERGEPRTRLTPADALTLARLGLVPFIAAARGQRAFLAGLAGAASTDFLDGRTARLLGTTRLGRDLDKVSDLAYLAAAARSARRAGWLSRPQLSLLAVRGIAPFLFATFEYFHQARRPALELTAGPRWAAPLVPVGLAAGALGRRRLAAAAVVAGSVAGAAPLAATLTRRASVAAEPG